MEFDQPGRSRGIFGHQLDPEVPDPCLAQVGQDGERALRPGAEDGIAAADVSHDRVSLPRAVAQLDPMTIARAPAGPEIGTVAQKRGEDTMLGVKDRQVMVDRHLDPLRRQAIHQAFELFGIQIEPRSDAREPQLQQRIERAGVDRVQRNVPHQQRKRARITAFAQISQPFHAAKIAHQDLVRLEAEEERLDPLFSRLLDPRQRQRHADPGGPEFSRRLLQPHQVQEVERDSSRPRLDRATHLFPVATEDDACLRERVGRLVPVPRLALDRSRPAAAGIAGDVLADTRDRPGDRRELRGFLRRRGGRDREVQDFPPRLVVAATTAQILEPLHRLAAHPVQLRNRQEELPLDAGLDRRQAVAGLSGPLNLGAQRFRVEAVQPRRFAGRGRHHLDRVPIGIAQRESKRLPGRRLGPDPEGNEALPLRVSEVFLEARLQHRIIGAVDRRAGPDPLQVGGGCAGKADEQVARVAHGIDREDAAADLVLLARRGCEEEPVPRLQRDRPLSARARRGLDDDPSGRAARRRIDPQDDADLESAVGPRRPIDEGLVVDPPEGSLTNATREDLLRLTRQEVQLGSLRRRRGIGPRGIRRRGPGRCRRAPRFLPSLVDGGAVKRGRGGDILGALHPPLDLEGGDSEGHQLRNAAVPLEVVRRKEVGAVLQVSRPPVDDQVVGQPAGLRTLAAVRAAPAPGFRREALPRVADAERPVDEHLQFGVDLRADPRDFPDRELPGEDHPLRSQSGGQTHTVRTGDRHLRRGMDVDSGRHLAHQRQDPQVLHDQPVRTGLGDRLEGVARPTHLLGEDEGVEDDVAPHPPATQVEQDVGEIP